MKIYVVVGSCGEYDDYRTWMTLGFEDLLNAEEYREKCIVEATRIHDEMNELDRAFREHEVGVTEYWDVHDKTRKSNTIDESYDWDEPVDYKIEELEVR